jgi:hypothetical protein
LTGGEGLKSEEDIEREVVAAFCDGIEKPIGASNNGIFIRNILDHDYYCVYILL